MSQILLRSLLALSNSCLLLCILVVSPQILKALMSPYHTQCPYVRTSGGMAGWDQDQGPSVHVSLCKALCVPIFGFLVSLCKALCVPMFGLLVSLCKVPALVAVWVGQD